MPTVILIVEDHDAVRESLREWLKVVFPHCCVVEAVDGEQAVALAQANPPRLVVMDIGLPGMNGIKATRCIKAIVPTAQVVILTIHEEQAYRTDAAAAGVSAYVPKTRMQSELLPTLTALLAAPDDAR